MFLGFPGGSAGKESACNVEDLDLTPGLSGPVLTHVHDYWKNHSFDYSTFVGKAMFLLFSTLSRFVIGTGIF